MMFESPKISYVNNRMSKSLSSGLTLSDPVRSSVVPTQGDLRDLLLQRAGKIYRSPTDVRNRILGKEVEVSVVTS